MPELTPPASSAPNGRTPSAPHGRDRAGGSARDRAGGSARDRATGRGTWHRRASKPIMGWILALLVLAVVHPWIPQYRWLLVHMVTLGLVTTSIMIWAQHFAEALLKTRLGEESRPRQVLRIRILTTGIIITMIGMVASWPWVTAVGAAVVGAMMTWFAASLGRQISAAIAPRFVFTVQGYVLASLLLPVGAVLGAILAFSPGEPWQGRLLLAHQVVNVLGFAGITIAATLLTLWPTVLRTKITLPAARRGSFALIGMAVGVGTAMTAALLGNVSAGLAGLIIILASLLWEATLLARLAIEAARKGPRPAPLPLFPPLSIGAGVLWAVASLIGMMVQWGLAPTSDGPLSSSLIAADVQRLTVPFVAGFLLQVLLGAMSFLMPTAMGGGPKAVSAGLTEMSRGAWLRVVAYNLALAVYVLTDVGGAVGDALIAALTLGTTTAGEIGSITRVLLTLVVFAVLITFVVLMLRGVRASVRARLAATADLPTPTLHQGSPAAGGPHVATPSSGPAVSPAGLAAAGNATRPAAAGRNAAADRSPVDRRALTGTLLAAGSVLGASALGSSIDRRLGGTTGADGADGTSGSSTPAPADVTPTGRTTTVEVSMADMRFHPDKLEVPLGDALVIDLRNDDPSDVHDLVLDSGVTSGRLSPGEAMRLEAGVVSGPLEGWCSIVGHRAMGMVLQVVAVGTDGSEAGSTPSPSGAGAVDEDPLARVSADLQQPPGEGFTRRDASMPEAFAGGAGVVQRVPLEITELDQEIAPGIAMQAMTFGGRVVGPTIRSEIGGQLRVDLANRGSMGHSLDLHAGRVAPDDVMRTIPPGEGLVYEITTDYAGIWLYHCSTQPMTVHLTSGMVGALIVPPQELAAADREYVLVQSEHYLVPGGDPGSARAVSPEKIAAERPDFTVFNGHANQYVHEPLTARVGERVRIWVLAAGPSRGISFHVVGAVFDTVFKEGEYLLRPENATGGGAQALDLLAAQGGFVEMVFDEPGTYTAVNHSFVEMERGARALIRVTA